MLSTIAVLRLIFAKIVVKSKCQRNFLEELFSVLPAIRGRFTFVNLSRYSHLAESTFRRNYSKYFDWLAFNYAIVELSLSTCSSPLIAAIDASFINKSGKHTFGLDKFWSSCASKTQKGLEISTLGLIEVSTGKAWTLDVCQTPSGLSTKANKTTNYSRVDVYIEQIVDCLPYLKNVRYIVADGYYAKTKVFNAIAGMNKVLITKLRPDANMKYLIETQKKQGQIHGNTKYDGKVNWKNINLDKWIAIGQHPSRKHIQIYTQELYHNQFKRRLKVVLLINTQTNKYVVIVTTDLFQHALEVLEYYQLRFQIEFLFRDAKQFMGLNQCQARDQHKLDFHFNMSLAAVNLFQVQMQLNQAKNKSMNSFIRKAYNTKVIKLVFEQIKSKADLSEFLDLKHPIIQKVINLGQVNYKKNIL